MTYINMGEFAALQKELHAYHVYDMREERNERFRQAKESLSARLFSSLKWAGKKAAFITSVPFYWFIIFRYFVGTIDAGLFVFVIAASFVMSLFGANWGLLNGLVR